MAIETPEQEFENPNDFYTVKEAKRYDSSSGMRRAQMELTSLAFDIYKEKYRDFGKDIGILDIGCGTGFSLEYLKENGYKKLIGIEPSKEMLALCRAKGFKCYLGDFENIPKEVTKAKYGLIISISALQWVLVNKQELEVKNLVKKLGKTFKGLLKEDGIVVIQYYPPNEDTNEIVVSGFERAGFETETYVYNKDSKKKRKYFLALKPKS